MRRWALFACLAAVALPFLVTRFPPITDLPQHAAQIRLLGEALHDGSSPYAVQWLTPYGLSYTIVGPLWLVAGPANAGRLAFLVVALLWVAALHALARRRRRPVAHAMLASVFVFSHVLYWGFLSFLAGWPVFVLWFCELDAEAEWNARRACRLAALGAMLYLTHALWFAFACLWYALVGLEARWPAREWSRRWLPVVPTLVLAGVWFVGLQSTRYRGSTQWVTAPWERLAPSAWVENALGGLRGRFEPIVLAALLAWLVAGALTQRRGWLAQVDRRLLRLGLMALVLYAVLPLGFQNTIRFAERWLPIACTSLFLALPAPAMRPRISAALALVAILAAGGVTASYWLVFDRVEMAGMHEALEALPQGQRVLGLDYMRYSRLVRGEPFLQDFAYAQVWRGGELNFSFADFAPSLVVYRPERAVPWAQGLEWFPERARAADTAFFDFVLLHGDERAQGLARDALQLEAVTDQGPWRLYRTAGTLGTAHASRPGQ